MTPPPHDDDPVPVDVQLHRWVPDDDDDAVLPVAGEDPCEQCGHPYEDHEEPVVEVAGRPEPDADDWAYRQRCDGRIVRYLA